MAKKLVGRKGRELAESVVTADGGRTLPKIRTTIKERRALDVLIPNIMVDLNGKGFKISPDYPRNELYRLVIRLGYRWMGEAWKREYPEWVKVN